MGETHLRNLVGLSGVRVLAVADPNRRGGRARAKAFANAEVALTDIEEAINHPGVDAVVIVTPTETHARLIELAVRPEGRVQRKADRASISPRPTEWYGSHKRKAPRSRSVSCAGSIPATPGPSAKIEAGELGKLETFRALSRDTYPPSLKFLLSSGGLFLDMAVHDLDLARFLVGDVEEVQAWGSVLIDEALLPKPTTLDTAVTMLCAFRTASWESLRRPADPNWGYDIRTEVAGSIGKVVVEARTKNAACCSRANSRASFDHFEKIFQIVLKGLPTCSCRASSRTLQAGRKPSPGPEDALESLRLAIAVTKSWKEGKPVKVSEVQ